MRAAHIIAALLPPFSSLHYQPTWRHRNLEIESVFGKYSTMAHEDEKSLRDEEADELLSEPAQSFEHGFGLRERCNDRQILWLYIVVVGSVLLNIVLFILLFRVEYRSSYGNYLILCHTENV